MLELPPLPFALRAVLPILPYVFGLGVAVLAIWFKAPRVTLMCGLIAGAHWVLAAFVPDLERAGAQGSVLMVIYAALAVLFPINAALIASKQDRGIISRGVLVRVLLFVVQVAAVLIIWDAGLAARTWADEILHTRIFEKAFDYWSLLPQPALLIFAVVTVGMFVRTLRSGGAIDGGLFGAVVLSAMALHSAGQGYLSAVLFSMATLILLVAVVHESYRLAFIDELTALPGRRALMHDLQSLTGRYTVAMLDVDHFKKFNDTYGHDVGDQVLKLVASRMMQTTGGGRAFRYGGEEFTILFPRKSVDQALPHLDKLRQAIADSSFKLRDEDRPDEKAAGPKKSKSKPSNTVSVRISIGAAERNVGQPADDALRAADEALYRAKDGGRNRVSV